MDDLLNDLPSRGTLISVRQGNAILPNSNSPFNVHEPVPYIPRKKNQQSQFVKNDPTNPLIAALIRKKNIENRKQNEDEQQSQPSQIPERFAEILKQSSTNNNSNDLKNSGNNNNVNNNNNSNDMDLDSTNDTTGFGELTNDTNTKSNSNTKPKKLTISRKRKVNDEDQTMSNSTNTTTTSMNKPQSSSSSSSSSTTTSSSLLSKTNSQTLPKTTNTNNSTINKATSGTASSKQTVPSFPVNSGIMIAPKQTEGQTKKRKLADRLK